MTQTQKWYWLALGLVALGLIYLLAPVLTPFMAAAILAYMGDPLADRLEKHLPRTLAVVIVFAFISLVAILLLIVLVPLVQQQLTQFMAKLPAYIDRVQTQFLPWLAQVLGLPGFNLDLASLKQAIRDNWSTAGGVAADLLATVSKSGMAMLLGLANIVLIPVLTFYLLRDWDKLVAQIHDLLPRSVEPVISRLAIESDAVLGAFLRGQLLVMIALGAIYSIGLWLVGLDFSLLIGLLAGLVSFVPYLGFLVGIVVAGVAAMLQFQDAFMLLPVLLVFGVGQVVESVLLTPLLVGDRIGLHPVAVIFAVMAGGQLFGFFGVLLALPTAAVIMVLLRYLHERYKESGLYR